LTEIERKTPKNFEFIVKEVEMVLFKEQMSRFNAKTSVDKTKDESNDKEEIDSKI